MPAGKRRHLITIQQSTDADDASGQPAETWATYCQRYADWESTGGTERFRGRQISAQMTHMGEIRADSVTRLITPGMRVLDDNGRIVNIKVVRELQGQRKYIEIQGTEVVLP